MYEWRYARSGISASFLPVVHSDGVFYTMMIPFKNL